MFVRRRGFALLAAAASLGVIGVHVLASRYSMNPDGISYLDVSDEVLRRGPMALVHGYWSPAYPALLAILRGILRPSLTTEVVWLHVLNGVLCLLVLASLGSFVSGLRRLLAVDDAGHPDDGISLAASPYFPGATLVLGLWLSIVLIELSLVTPDLLIAIWVFLACGLIVRAARDRAELVLHAALGVLVGLAYLTKAALLPFGLPFLVTSALWARQWRHRVARMIVSGATFLVVALPFIILLSEAKGRPTFGDVGRIAYARCVNDVAGVPQLQLGPSGTGRPIHPTRQVSLSPAVYEFRTPVPGSYPVLYDVSYWYDGIRPRIDVPRMAWLAWAHGLEYAGWMMPLIVVAVTLILINGARNAWKDVHRSWPLWVPALLPFIGYGIMYSESRYVAPFIGILAVAAVGALRVRHDPTSLGKALILALTVAYAIPVLAFTVQRLPGAFGALKRAQPQHPHARVAGALRDAGVQPGSEVFLVGSGVNAYWARQAQSRIVGEIPDDQVPIFWGASTARRDSILDIFERAGANIAVAPSVPAWADTTGWASLGSTGFYFRRLAVPGQSPRRLPTPILATTPSASVRCDEL